MKQLFLIFTFLILCSHTCLSQNKEPENSGEKVLSATGQITETQKQDFLRLLKTLPHKGEFFTDEAGKTAAAYLPVLFALTQEDLEKYDIYPFLTISISIFDQNKYRDYAISHFTEIRHPYIKFFWACLLFNYGKPSNEIVLFLKSAFDSPANSKMLSEMIGPKFEDFKRRVMAYPIK